MDLTPREVAATDQEIAGFTHTLTRMTADWPAHHPDEPRAVRLGTYGHRLSGLTHQQVCFMLAVAVERLAGAD